MNPENEKNDALKAEQEHKTAVESAADYVENFDILETITNVGNDEVFTPRKTCNMMLDSLPEEVWHNPNYKWLNPASKNGVFEREIAIRLDEGLKDVIPNDEERRKHILQKMIFSIGQTMFTANVARRTVYYCSQANRKCDGIKAPDGHYVNGYAIGNGTWFDDEEGNIKTPNAQHVFYRGEHHCHYCGISDQSDYLDKNQREKYAYEFIHYDDGNGNNAQKFRQALSRRFFGGNSNMKFDIIIGNPPYQLSDGGAFASATPIYQLFVERAKELNPKYLCMIVPSRWMTGGKGLDDFRKEMIADRHIRKLEDFEDGKECFPSNEIKGGVCFFLWSRDEEGKCEITSHKQKEGIHKSVRYLQEDGADVFIRDERLVAIFKKVMSAKITPFSKIVSPRKPYGLSGDFFKDPSKYGLPPISSKEIKGGFTIYGLDEHLKRVTRYIPRDYPIPKKELLSGYKLFVPRNQGNGTFGETFSEPILGCPDELCTETFVVFGPFSTEEEAKNCDAYFRTKFFRALLGIRKLDQNASQSVYEYVPLLDFHKTWTDDELFKRFGFSNDDISFIKNNVQEMA